MTDQPKKSWSESTPLEALGGLPMDVDARILSRLRAGHLTLVPSMYCNTFNTYRHRGWRGFLIYGWRPPGFRFLRCPKKWFKPERKERIFYWMHGDQVVCSFENYAHVKKLLDEICGLDSKILENHSAMASSTILSGDTSLSQGQTVVAPPSSKD